MILKSTFANVAILVVLLLTSSGIDTLKSRFFSYDTSLTMWGFLSIGQVTLLVYLLGTLIRAAESTYNEFKNFMLPISHSRAAPQMRQSASLQSSRTSAKQETLLQPIAASVTRHYNKHIKAALMEMNEAKLIILCYDQFPKLYDTFKPHHKHWQRVDLLLDYVEETKQFEKLAKRLGLPNFDDSDNNRSLRVGDTAFYLYILSYESKEPKNSLENQMSKPIAAQALIIGALITAIATVIAVTQLNLPITLPQFTSFIGIMAIILLITNETLKRRMNKLRQTHD